MNLGKNMMLDTADNKIFFPRFYDIDTICSYDNSGQLKFDVDIEMEQGYWNTSSSRLWTRIRDLMHDDIVTTYNNMRQNGVSYENMMHYIYDEQIAKIPQAYYNKDYDVKYAPFADSYIGMAHGDTYEHVKRWLKQRFTFVDTLFDYAPSYNNDVLTIRANTTELMTLEIETYTPVYQHLSWYNGQMDKKKIDGKVSVEFSGTAQAATDQEVLIYGGSNVKSIKGITSMNPNRMLIGSATKLVEIDAHDCPLLADINANKANLSPHEYLNKVNLSNCPLLEGNLKLNNSPLVQELDIRGTNITGMNLPGSIRNLQVLRLPNTMTELTLNDANMLHTLEFDEGVNLQSISMTNCNALENVTGLDLLQTPSITLNNSYNTVAELYFRDTTNLSLSNMSNLERVIFTPNNEYETFELINVANAPDYKITTFNCPKLSTFMTTAPYRESYNDCGTTEIVYIGKGYQTVLEEYNPNGEKFKHTLSTHMFDKDNGVEIEIDVSSCIGGKDENIVSIGVTSIDYYKTSGTYHFYYNSQNRLLQMYNASTQINTTITLENNENIIHIKFNKSGLFINDIRYASYSYDNSVNAILVGSEEGVNRSNATINHLRYYTKVPNMTIQAKDYGDVKPNEVFEANLIDISNTQFTDVKLLCTTDTNTLKLPTTVKNFYCDSSFDLDTDYLEDGEYDVVHGELVEQYTTDYEGEVVYAQEQYFENILLQEIGIKPGTLQWSNPTYLTTNSTEYYVLNEPLKVVGGTLFKNTGGGIHRISEYDENLNLIKYGGTDGYNTIILDNNTRYIAFNIRSGEENKVLISYTGAISKTPNLIPSSADGSLIFSMYAPNNTVAPASGTWDLKGLTFDNFHTFGMNNDVKPSEDSFIEVADVTNMKVFKGGSARNEQYGNIYYDIGQSNGRCITNILLKAGIHKIEVYTKDGTIIAPAVYWSYTLDGVQDNIWYNAHLGQNLTTDIYITIGFNGVTNEPWFDIDGVRYYLDNMEYIDTHILLGGTDTYTPSGTIMASDYGSILHTHGEIPTSKKINEVKSITMPSRYDDYNITIKNANISPKEYNTMLYPLLVNEDNPIEGKLDYTNYEGNNLSWSFAYVNMNKVNIVQPKDELLNTYEYRYNAFYETEYEFDDPNEVLRYITSSSNLLPTFNEGFTYTYDKLDNNDGTYIYRIYANDPTLLTSFELEKVPYLRITNAENLLSPIDLTKYETVSISESYYDITELYFREATNLTLTNMPYLERVIYLPNDEYEVFEIINVVNSKDYIITTSECPRLTTFMTTASHRESYNNEDAIAEVITEFTNTDNELFTNEYVFSKTYWEEDGTEIQGSVNLLHYEIPSIEDSVKAIHMIQGLDSTNRVTFFNDDKFISCEVITTACELDFKLHRDCNRIVFICEREGIVSSVTESILTTTLVKEYGSVEPNIIFNANTLDISNTQFTDVKLLCTTDLNILKLPITVKNFYCDSSFDLDTNYLTDGEYNYIHNDLVKEYTTNYEDEIRESKYNTILVSNNALENISVPGGTILTYTSNGTLAELINEYDSNANLLANHNTYNIKTYDNSTGLYKGSITLNNNTSYISIIAMNTSEFKVTLMELYSPNLIPSSADGSLIFSMYAPNKTVQPASNTWDLYGLEFDNFHTFGMNNDVKGELEVKELRNNTTIYRILDERYSSNTLYGLSYGTSSGTPGSYSVGCSISPILLDEDITSITITTSNGCSMFHYNSTDYDGVTATAQGFSGGGTSSGATLGVVSEKRLRLITFQNDTNLEWFDMTLVGNETKTIRYYMEDMIIIDVNDERRKTWNTVLYDTIYETTSLSMPSRYNNYNVTIKNANIKPTTHNTMLYPLLVNEDNPIEGKLDYTDYNGEYLSWSFAYTNTNKVNIIQPKDELLNTYGYRYNAFYRTEYEFNNPNEVMEYTTTSSDLLPIFNEGFTYAYDKIDNDNGTYTYKIYANDISLLTSFELEKVPYLRIVNAENLISPIDLTKYEVVEIDNSYNSISELYFKDATDLTLNNIPNLEKVIYVPNSEYDTFELINITNASNYNIVTFNCPKLSTFMTTAPYRESYNNCGMRDKELIHTEELLDGTYEMGGFWGDTGGYVNQTGYRMYEANIPSDADELIINIELTSAGSSIILHYFEDDTFISRLVKTEASWSETVTKPSNCNKVIISVNDSFFKSVSLTYNKVELIQVKDYGDIQPNTTFTANSIDISSTQFTDVKLLCTTDTNTLKLPTTVKNFYCDSSFDLDTYWLEDGEYDVVHGELVEPYTTDYEGEVNRYIPEVIYCPKGTSEITITTDFIKVHPGTYVSIDKVSGNDGYTVRIYEYKSADESDGNGLTYAMNSVSTTLKSDTNYVKLFLYSSKCDYNVTLTKVKTPNLIPSAADGSLIFSMYAPSNSVAPASGTWDLKGLEFDNFHTYGMNNDVKGEYNVDTYTFVSNSRDNKTNIYDSDIVYEIETTTSNVSDSRPLIIAIIRNGLYQYVNLGLTQIMTFSEDGKWTNIKLKDLKDGEILGKLSIQILENTLTVNNGNNLIYRVNLDELTYVYANTSEYTEGSHFESFYPSSVIARSLTPTSITMPARYDDYNITIKNANISPKTHNTMLYPLLVNEDNPITGTLDYTNYEGNNLSWSFAYTDLDKVQITQPKDELLHSYEYKYNAFYQTDYEFDDPYEIARYTSSASGVLPTFNSEFTYTYDEIDNGDGTYTIKIYTDSFDNLPTRISFATKSVISVDKLNTSQVTNLNGLFQNCDKLTYVNTANWVTSNVTNMNNMFHSCKKLTSLDLSGFDTKNVTTMNRMFDSCNSLTALDVSGFDTSKVTDMQYMFAGCSGLTSLDVSGFNTSKVTVMLAMFTGCNSLTTLDVSGFDTGSVNNMNNMFQNCNNLTSLDVSGFDTSNVNGMNSMFFGCNKLTSLDVSEFNTSKVITMSSMFTNCRGLTSLDLSEFDTSNVTNMEGMFYGCSSLKEVKGIENWDCSKVDKFGSMFQDATAFGGDLDLRNWKVGQNATVTTIYSFMNGCANLKSVDMSGWVLPDNTNLANFMANQSSLHTVKVIGWSAINIQNICSAIGSYVGGTIYGDVLIDETYLNNNWIYENVLEVAVYTCNTSGILPNFNTEFTYTHAEVDNRDGTYTTKISADSIENLPTSISFYTKSALLSVERMNVSKVTSAQGMFYQCSNVTYINSSNWDTSSMTTMNNMFDGCSKLTSLDVSGFDTVNVTNMFGMFSVCSGLTSLDVSGFDTSKVTNMSAMFDSCPNLTVLDVSNFDTSNVTNMSMMFRNCNKLIALNVSNFDTSKVTIMGEMFSRCNVLSIEGLGNWDVKNVTDMGSMFLHCRGITSLLEISDWDTSSLKKMYRMFMGCNELIELDISNWNTSKLEALNETFYDCKKIISFNLGNWDCRRVISIGGAFHGCTSLSSITLPKEVSKGCNSVSAFRNCTNLKEVALPKGVGDIAHIFNNCNNLEKAVIPLDNINNAQDSTFNNCRALIDVDWVGDLSNNFNIITNTGEHITTESDIHELMTNLGDLKKDKIKISLSKETIKVNDTEKTIE